MESAAKVGFRYSGDAPAGGGGGGEGGGRGSPAAAAVPARLAAEVPPLLRLLCEAASDIFKRKTKNKKAKKKIQKKSQTKEFGVEVKGTK